MSNNTKWTDEDTDILKKHWDKYVHYQNRNSKIAEFLPNRGSVNVYLKAKKTRIVI